MMAGSFRRDGRVVQLVEVAGEDERAESNRICFSERLRREEPFDGRERLANQLTPTRRIRPQKLGQLVP